MSAPLPEVFLARHGETAWSLTGQHTGLTDLPLTIRGEQNARRLGESRLQGMVFEQVFTSPLLRASRTCELAGFGDGVITDPDLVEWNYGAYEGLTSAQIRQQNPDWKLFRDGCPAGESVADVIDRADRVVERLRQFSGRVLLFSSGHFLRTLAARWLGLELAFGQYLYLGTAALSMLGYEHDRSDPVIRLWNDDRHLSEPRNHP